MKPQIQSPGETSLESWYAVRSTDAHYIIVSHLTTSLKLIITLLPALLTTST
jgi:hypothetical protein